MNEATAQRLRNGLIALAIVILSVGLFVGNAVRTQSVSLSALADQSVPLETARSNGNPTLIEFYADWCTTCQSMAPMMADLKTEFQDQINFVMLNVDNPKWLPELTQFQVNGIPHFIFVGAEGNPQGEAIGEQPESILRSNLIALGQGDPLATPDGIGRRSNFQTPLEEKEAIRQPDPRSHG